MGFSGDLKAFFNDLRTNKKYQPASKTALREGYESIGRRVDDKVRTLFSTMPKAPLEIRAVPAFLEQSQAAGYYQQGTPDGSRPGFFFFNTYDLPSRSLWGMETLYLHEGAPGALSVTFGDRPEGTPSWHRPQAWSELASSMGFHPAARRARPWLFGDRGST